MDANTALDDRRDRLAQQGGKLLEEREVLLEGTPGRELSFSTTGGSPLTIRIYVSGRRIFQVLTVSEEPDLMSRSDVQAFLDSFRLLPRDLRGAENLPVFMLRGAVLFPDGRIPLVVGRPATVKLLQDAVAANSLICVVAQRDPGMESPTASDLFPVGVKAQIEQVTSKGSGEYSVVLHGLERVRLGRAVQQDSYMVGHVEPLPDLEGHLPDLDEILGKLRQLGQEVMSMDPDLPAAALNLPNEVRGAAFLPDALVANTDNSLQDRQRVLETVDLVARTNLVLDLLTKRRAALQKK